MASKKELLSKKEYDFAGKFCQFILHTLQEDKKKCHLQDVLLDKKETIRTKILQTLQERRTTNQFCCENKCKNCNQI